MKIYDKENSLFCENRGDVGCNMFYILENLINFENAERYKQLTSFWLTWFFLFFSNSKSKSSPLTLWYLCYLFPWNTIVSWVTLYFWRVPHNYKLRVLIFSSKGLIFFLLSQTSLYFEHPIRSLAISRKLELTAVMF